MTPEIIAAVEKLVSESTAHFWLCPGTTLTCCVLALPGGFTVLGKSACLDPKQFDADVGRKLAFDDAVNELLKLEIYRQAHGPRIEIARPGDVPGLN